MRENFDLPQVLVEPCPARWLNPLVEVADRVVAAAATLQAAWGIQDGTIAEAVRHLHLSIVGDDAMPEPQARAHVAALASQIHSAASTLDEFVIPSSNERAHQAAADCANAALDVLIALQNDFGIYPAD